MVEFFFKEYDFKIEFPTYKTAQLLMGKRAKGWNSMCKRYVLFKKCEEEK